MRLVAAEKRCANERYSGVVGTQRYCDDFQHLYALAFQLESGIRQCDHWCVPLAVMVEHPSNVPPKISLQTANLMIWKGQYIRAQSIKKSPQTQSYQGFASHSVWCRWRGSNPHGLLAQRILSYLLHTEYKRTQPRMEVIDGHQSACNYWLF